MYLTVNRSDNFCHLLITFANSLNPDQAKPGPVVQSVASPTADPGVASSILTRSHTLVEIDHEIISTFIQEGLSSVTSKSMCKKYVRYWSSLFRKKRWLGDMTIAIDWDVKHQSNIIYKQTRSSDLIWIKTV